MPREGPHGYELVYGCHGVPHITAVDLDQLSWQEGDDLWGPRHDMFVKHELGVLHVLDGVC